MAIFGSPRRGWNIKNIVLVKIFEKIVYIKSKFYCTHIMGFTSPSSVILFFFKTSNDFSSTTIFNFLTFHFWSIDKYRFWIVFISVGIMRHALLLAPLINIWRRWRSARITSLLYRPPGINNTQHKKIKSIWRELGHSLSCCYGNMRIKPHHWSLVVYFVAMGY